MDKVILSLIIILVILFVVGFISVGYLSTAPCSELSDISYKDLPARCVKEFTK